MFPEGILRADHTCVYLPAAGHVTPMVPWAGRGHSRHCLLSVDISSVFLIDRFPEARWVGCFDMRMFSFVCPSAQRRSPTAAAAGGGGGST